MVISHYGVGFAAKLFAPKVPLFVLMAASLLPDILWVFFFLLFGLEQGGGVDGMTPSAASTIGGPYSHSLMTSAACAALAGSAYAYVRSEWRGGLAIALCLLSHWLLDALVHDHDLLLSPGSDAAFGLGLGQQPFLAAGAEVVLFSVGVWLYAAGTKKAAEAGGYWLQVFVAFLALAYASSLFMPQSHARQILWRAVILSLFPLVYLFDRHRAEKERLPKPERQPPHAEARTQRETYVPPASESFIPQLAARPASVREGTAEGARTESEVRARAEPQPETDTQGRRSKRPLLVPAAIILLLAVLVASMSSVMYLNARSDESAHNQNAVPEASPESAEAAEERRHVAEAVESKVEQCRRLSPALSSACRKALESYKDDPVLRRLLIEDSEESNIGGLTTLVVTNWKRNNFADVFSSLRELGLEPVEDPRSLQSLVRAKKIKIDRVSIRWDGDQKLFVVDLTVLLLKADEVDAEGPKVDAIIPKGQIIEAKWENILTPLPPGVESAAEKSPAPTQNILTPIAYKFTIRDAAPTRPNYLIALCLNEDFERPGSVQPVAANLSAFKLNIDEFQRERFVLEEVKKNPVETQHRVHEIIRDYYERR